jgi:hypothetical protein
VSVPYAAVTLVASGGTAPYKWSVSSGALPTGLTLSTDGMVSGNPSITGGSFTVRVDDAAGQAAGAKTSIPIAARFNPGSPCVNGCSVEQGCVNVCGTYATLNGGVGPYQYTLTSGAPPLNTSLNGPTLSGPINAGGPPFSVDITDSFGIKAPVTALFSVFPHLTVFAGKPGGGATNAPVTIVLLYRGGDGKITSVTATAPAGYAPGAPGATFTYDSSTITVTIPPPFHPNGWTLQVTVTDGSLCGPAAGQRCSFAVMQPMNMG